MNVTSLEFRKWLIGQLRRISYRWSPRYEAMKDIKIGRNQYKCPLCEKVVGVREIKKDHITPVIDPVKGFVDWDTFIKRLFVDKEGFQAICVICHNRKSARENEIRRNRKSTKRSRK